MRWESRSAAAPWTSPGFLPVGFQNSATGLVLGFYAARSYSLMRPPRAGWRLIRSWERSATWVVGSGRLQLEAAVESPSDVVGLVPARITRKCRWPSDFTALAAFLPLRDIPSATRTQPAPALGRSGSSRSMPPQKDSTPAWHLRVTPWPGALRSVQTEAGTGRREGIALLVLGSVRQHLRRRIQMKTRNVLISGAGVAGSALAYWPA